MSLARITTTKICRNLKLSRRMYCKKDDGDPDKRQESSETSNLNLGDMRKKYRVFREEESEIILDVQEERLKYLQLLEENEVQEADPFAGINLERKLCLFVSLIGSSRVLRGLKWYSAGVVKTNHANHTSIFYALFSLSLKALFTIYNVCKRRYAGQLVLYQKVSSLWGIILL